MDSNLQSELNSCIRELISISTELEEAARNVDQSIKGMSTTRYVNTLEYCARKYRAAANRLERIR